MYRKGWKRAGVVDDEPVPYAIDFLRTLIEHDLLTPTIYSGRFIDPTGTLAVYRWLRRQGISERELEGVKFCRSFPPSRVFIDARSMPYCGSFPEPSGIANFQTWQKPDVAPSKRRKVVCVEFDRVIHLDRPRWQSETSITDIPMPGAPAFLRALLEANFQLCIMSNRVRHAKGASAIRTWLERYGMPDIMRHAQIRTHVSAAWLTLMPRCFSFTGTFPSIDALLAFKPWHKRPDFTRHLEAQGVPDL